MSGPGLDNRRRLAAIQFAQQPFNRLAGGAALGRAVRLPAMDGALINAETLPENRLALT